MWPGIRYRIILSKGSDPTEERADVTALLARPNRSVRAKKGLGGGKDVAMADPRFCCRRDDAHVAFCKPDKGFSHHRKESGLLERSGGSPLSLSSMIQRSGVVVLELVLCTIFCRILLSRLIIVAMGAPPLPSVLAGLRDPEVCLKSFCADQKATST